MEERGKGKAVASMVLGIISLVLLVTGYGAAVSVLLSIIGMALAGSSKRDGYTGSVRTTGVILNMFGVVVGIVVFVACIACVGVFGYSMMEYADYGNYYYY